VDQRKRCAVGFFDALEERDDVRLAFGRQLGIAQYDIRKRVDRTHQQRIAPFARGIQVADVSAPIVHVCDDIRGTPLLGNGQIGNEFGSQQRDFPRTDMNVSFREFRHDLFFVAIAQEKGVAGMDHHVVAEVGARRNQRAQLFGSIGPITCRADQNRFPCVESANMQCTDHPETCLLNLEFASAVAAVRSRRTKIHNRRIDEQIGSGRTLD